MCKPSGLLIDAALAGELAFLGLRKEGPLLLVVELVVVEMPCAPKCRSPSSDESCAW